MNDEEAKVPVGITVDNVTLARARPMVRIRNPFARNPVGRQVRRPPRRAEQHRDNHKGLRSGAGRSGRSGAHPDAAGGSLARAENAGADGAGGQGDRLAAAVHESEQEDV